MIIKTPFIDEQAKRNYFLIKAAFSHLGKC